MGRLYKYKAECIHCYLEVVGTKEFLLKHLQKYHNIQHSINTLRHFYIIERHWQKTETEDKKPVKKKQKRKRNRSIYWGLVIKTAFESKRRKF